MRLSSCHWHFVMTTTLWRPGSNKQRGRGTWLRKTLRKNWRSSKALWRSVLKNSRSADIRLSHWKRIIPSGSLVLVYLLNVSWKCPRVNIYLVWQKVHSQVQKRHWCTLSFPECVMIIKRCCVVVFLGDDCTTVAEPGAAWGLPAPHRDSGSAASSGHTALQQSWDSRSSSTGIVTHACANNELHSDLMTEKENAAVLFFERCCPP